MNAPFASRRHQAGLIGGIVAAALLLLGFIAHALGFVGFDARGSGDDPAAGIEGASPSDIFSTPYKPEWFEVYGGTTLWLDSILAGTDECTRIHTDLSAIAAGGVLPPQGTSSATSPSEFDLIWDPCSRYGQNEILLYPNEDGDGSLWAAGTGLDAESCSADFDRLRWEEPWAIDPTAPEASSLEEGMVLCMLTDADQIVLAELTFVGPAEGDTDWLGAAFVVTVWERL